MKTLDFTIGRKKNGRVVNTTIYHPKKCRNKDGTWTGLKSTFVGIGSKHIGITFIYIKANGDPRIVKKPWGNSPKYYFGTSSSFDKAKANVWKNYKIKVPSLSNFEKIKFKHYANDELNERLIKPAAYIFNEQLS
jgi:hypothetical protein|tara:strand:- start:1280 stop:1684 length:405 start_codon:yes stop_codon:yes gene_type:complete